MERRHWKAWRLAVAGRASCEHRYSWWTEVALVLAPLGQAVVGSPLWPRLSPNMMCAVRCVMPRLRVNRERLKRESDNREDMVAFLVAEQKLSAVSQWEAERHGQVRLEADQRRAEQRLDGARALARMRDRGQTVADIAQLGGCSVKLVRRYLKELQSAAPVSGTASGNASRALGPGGTAVASDFSQALGGGEDTAVEVESSTAAAGVGGHP